MSAQCAGLLGWLAACDAHANGNFRSGAARVLTALGLVVADWQDEVLAELERSPFRTDPEFARLFADTLAGAGLLEPDA